MPKAPGEALNTPSGSTGRSPEILSPAASQNIPCGGSLLFQDSQQVLQGTREDGCLAEDRSWDR